MHVGARSFFYFKRWWVIADVWGTWRTPSNTGIGLVVGGRSIFHLLLMDLKEEFVFLRKSCLLNFQSPWNFDRIEKS